MKKLFTGCLAALMFLGFAQVSSAETSLRLSTLYKPGSPGANYANDLAEKVKAATNGELVIKVYPASQLGDWVEITDSVMQGAVDMALQPFGADLDKRLAVGWFPFIGLDFDSSEEVYGPGGVAYGILDELIEPKGLSLLGVYVAGMGGMGFNTEVTDITDPQAKHKQKVRVWPGGTTHRVLIAELGYNPAVVPYSDLYTALQTGVVDGHIGNTAVMTLADFKDVTKTWFQLNDHFEPGWIFMNSKKLDSLTPELREALVTAAKEMTATSFSNAKIEQQEALDEMRAAGISVVELNREQLEAFANYTREKVWPKIADEVGDDIMKRLTESATGN